MKISGHHKMTVTGMYVYGVQFGHCELPLLKCGLLPLEKKLFFFEGIAALPDSSFISSALDGTVQTCCMVSSAGQVTPTPVAMETGSPGGGGGGGGRGGGAKDIRAQGVAVSEMGVFAAVSVRYVGPIWGGGEKLKGPLSVLIVSY